MLAGYATLEGTAAYRQRFARTCAAGHFRSSAELWLSSIGLGTYLGDADERTDALYAAAMTRAVEMGCNVLDAAINYRHQRSERVIGRVLATRIRADVARAAARLRPAAEALALYRREIAPLITRNLELLERGYRAGELGATELIPQQQQFAGAAEALIQAELEFNEAYAEFERALGR